MKFKGEEMNKAKNQRVKLPWEAMKLTFIGQMGKLVQEGMGKTTVLTGDPGEALKAMA